MRYALGRGMGAVRGREGVIDIEVGQFGQAGRELGVVGFLGGVEAHVFQQDDAAGVQIGNGRMGRAADAVLGEAHRRSQQFRQGRDQRLQAHRRHDLALGAVEVGQQGDLGSRFAQLVDRRQGDPQTSVVGDPAVLHRDIEVYADQSGLARERAGVIEGAEGHRRDFPFFIVKFSDHSRSVRT